MFIFGPSCGGKSTLALTLLRELGNDWTCLDRDALIDDEGHDEENVNRVIDEKLTQHTIVDAQIPWREKRAGEFYFLVLPPLDTLLKRDEERTSEHSRSEDRAKWCRHYVIETYDTLRAWPKEPFDACFDSSVLSVAEEVDAILTHHLPRMRENAQTQLETALIVK